MLRQILVVAFVSAGFVVAEGQELEPPKPAAEHDFLKRFVGEWDCENEAFMNPGQPPLKYKGTMTGQMIGEFWAIVVVQAGFGGQTYVGQATFGFDSLTQKKYFGTWTDSMSGFMWKYEGIVDGNKLILNSEGPDPADPGKMIKARDTWEFKSKDLIELTGQFEGPDGKLMSIMTATCTRKQ